MRGGLLRQGSILTVTSYATRTSPVIRGKWILENMLGAPPPPPPANVPALEGQHGRGDALGARAAGRAPRQRRLRELPQADGSRSASRSRTSTRSAAGGPSRRARPIDVAGGLPDGSQFEGVAGLEAGAARRGRRLFVGTLDGEAADLRAGPGRRAVRRARPSARSSATPGARTIRFSSLIVGIVNSTPFQMRRSRMIITKKALPRRTFLRGLGATLALPLLDAMVPVDDRAGRRRRPIRLACAAWASSTCRWAATSRRWTPPGESRLDELVADAQPARAGQGARHGDHEPGTAERLSRHARDLQRRLPERGQGEADREHRLLPRHDGRSDRRQADRPGDAAAVARTGDGSALRPSASATTATPASIRTISRGRRRRRRCRRRRIRGSSSSACSAKAAAPPTAAPRSKKRASLLDSVTEEIARLQNKLGPGRSRQGRPVSRHRPRGRAPHSEGRGRTRRTTRCRISIGRWACRPPTPTTRG